MEFIPITLLIILFLTNCPFMNFVGAHDAPVSSTSTNIKLTEAPIQKTTQPAPRSPISDASTAAPTSNVSTANPESGLPKTPAKGTID